MPPADQREGCVESTPTVAQALSLPQPPVGGWAVSASRASMAQRRCRSARRAAARRRARVPSRTRAGAPARRPRSHRSPRPATQAQFGKRPQDQERVQQDDEGLQNPDHGRRQGRSGPQRLRRRGARSAAMAAAAYLPLSRTIASDPSPVVRHANDTAQDAMASRLGVDGHLRRDEASVGRRRCISGSRGAVFGGRPLACSRSGVTIRLGREQRRCTHEREKARPSCPGCLERRPALRHGSADPALAHALGGHQGRGRGTDAG
jgi:hypothetical protein